MKKIKDIVIPIVDSSTIHGLPNIFRSKQLIIKLIWLLSTTFSLVACVFFIVQSISNYLRYEFLINIDDIYEHNLEFPTVSFCSGSYNITKNNFKNLLIVCTYKNDNDCLLNSEK